MTIHSFRHLLGAIGVDKDIPLELIGEILGHTSASSTKRYTSVKKEKRDKAFDSIFKEYLKPI